ncbi:hypothetical protein PoB_006261800 [Plakobranchus ocellatus]|uniref:Uncharacterized protein n=1 Tax=Plakobranchus ocellatus TaxID=259542 RepID=A0AAV4CW75_9GAST|nr:hypothetical protein PoB_006261800 [Plakobranchus ocellatus]
MNEVLQSCGLDLHICHKYSEVNYLRMTSSPNIRQMRRVKVDSKYKMQKFTDEELRTSIRNAVKPTDDVQLDVNSLLNTVL